MSHMTAYTKMTAQERKDEYARVSAKFEELKARGYRSLGPAESEGGIERNELLVEAMGLQGLGWSGEGFDERELGQTRAWLRSKGNSIEGGTSEINLNVVAKQVLGLRDHQ